MINKKATVPILSVGADREQPQQLRKISIADHLFKNNWVYENLPSKSVMGRRGHSG